MSKLAEARARAQVQRKRARAGEPEDAPQTPADEPSEDEAYNPMAEAERRYRARQELESPQDEQPQEAPDDGPDETPLPVNDMAKELASLRQQMNSLLGRVAPVQRQADEYRGLLDAEKAETAKLRQQIEEMQRDLQAAKAKPFNPMEVLTDEERGQIDETSLAIITKLAQAAAKQAAPQPVDFESEFTRRMQQREAGEIDNYRKQVLNTGSLKTLLSMVGSPDLDSLTGSEEGVEIDALMESLLSAQTKPAIDRYAKAVERRFKSWQDAQKAPKQKTTQADPTTRLESAMRRAPQRQQSPEDIEKLSLQIRQLSRSRDPADRKRAAELLNKL